MNQVCKNRTKKSSCIDFIQEYEKKKNYKFFLVNIFTLRPLLCTFLTIGAMIALQIFNNRGYDYSADFLTIGAMITLQIFNNRGYDYSADF